MKTLYKNLMLTTTLVSAAIFSSLLYAHHSTAGFDTDKVVRIEATITKFRWTNPHASIRLEGVVEGKQAMWAVEMTAPNVLINSGWKRNSLKKGDEVIIFANPTRNDVTLRDGSLGGLYVGAILTDGTILGRTDEAEDGDEAGPSSSE